MPPPATPPSSCPPSASPPIPSRPRSRGNSLAQRTWRTWSPPPSAGRRAPLSPGDLAGPGSTGGRGAVRAEGLPERTEVTARLPAALSLCPPWHLSRTYLWREGTSVSEQGTSDGRRAALRVASDAEHPRPALDSEFHRDEGDDGSLARPAGRLDQPLIEAWLARAAVDGSGVPGREVHGHGALAAAAGLCADPRRHSFVAPAAGSARGHATTLVRVTDQVSGPEHVELFDVLVEEGPGKAALQRGLVQACAELAGRLRLPLLGHVVHRHPALGPDHAAAVVDGLVAQGWRPAFCYWSFGDPACR